jgi:uncharacterized membrane protein (UPF0136 family)
MSLWYGIFVAIAGVMGFVKAGSVVSLYSGLICGAAAIVGSRLSGSIRYRKAGLILLAITGAVLAAVFSKRILSTGEFMPGGFLFLNSGGMLMVALKALQEVTDAANVPPAPESKKTK